MKTYLECHKGSFCVYTPRFCQEGYCSECEIYQKVVSKVGYLDTLMAQNRTKQLNNVVSAN